MNSHYFCSFCNDVVHMHFTERHEVCPVCHNHSAVWVPDTTKPQPISPEKAQELFNQIYDKIKTLPQ
jgi:hypothetical protein